MSDGLKSILRKAAFAAALVVGLVSAAQAATLYISEFPAGTSASGSTVAQILGQPKLADQTVGLSGSSAVSAAFNAKTHAVIMQCDEGCSVSFGGSTITAATTNYLLQQGVPYTFAVAPSTFVAAIANAAGNTGGGGGGGGNVVVTSPVDAFNHVQTVNYDSFGNALTYNGNGQALPANSIPVVGASGTIAGGSTGTAGTAATTVVTVQGIASGTPEVVNLTQVAGASVATGHGTAAGALRVELPTDGTGLVTAAQATAANLNATVVGTGTFAVQAQQTPVTSGGLSWYFVQPAASDNHVVIKAGAGQVYHIAATNNSATINYIRLYNATTGFNGCNSATNIVGQWAVPASTSGAGLVADIAQGIAFATGISICVSSGYATTDTTNATATAMSVNIGYK